MRRWMRMGSGKMLRRRLLLVESRDFYVHLIRYLFLSSLCRIRSRFDMLRTVFFYFLATLSLFEASSTKSSSFDFHQAETPSISSSR